MFGKPAWFRPSRGRLAVVPIRWQGVLYFVTWAAVVLLPTAGLLGLGRLPEALIWTATSLAGLAWEMRHIRRQLRVVPAEEILVIDENTPTPTFTSRKFFFFRS